MHKKFEIGSCQSGRKVVPQDSKSDLPLKYRGIRRKLAKTCMEVHVFKRSLPFHYQLKIIAFEPLPNCLSH